MSERDELARIESAAKRRGEHSPDYHIGACMVALREADKLAAALGVEQISFHSRLEQYAALAWQTKQALADLAAEREREAEVIKESVARVMSDDELGDDLGYWDSCTGCHETNEGQETGDYPFSDIFGCHLGGGCTECGGLGAVWHFMPDEMLEQMAQEARDGQGGGGCQ